jgi:hypothetical protein
MRMRKGRSPGTLGEEVYVNSKDGQVVRSCPPPPMARYYRLRVP